MPNNQPKKIGRPRKINLEEAVRLRGESWTWRSLALRYDVDTSALYYLFKAHGFLVTETHPKKGIDKALGVGEESGESASSLTCKES